ncbi:MAG: isoprenylcysteine carboxylmethyltransferase family protein [Flavobacteriaceae bacterium]
MALKIPPFLVYMIFGGLMYLLSMFLPVGYFDFFGRFILIKILIVLGMVICITAIVQFFRNKTTMDPSDPSKTTVLVTRGIYNYTRNPMYFSMLLFLLAWGLWLGNAFNTILAAGFVAYMNRFQIIPEETALKMRFGKAYVQYLAMVRRWF